MKIECSVSLGELVDKISILKVKKININDAAKLKYIDAEFKTLSETLDVLSLEKIEGFMDELVNVNSSLWKIEDDIRDKERKKVFDQEFIDLARSVYEYNDERFAIKNKINEFYGSGLREVKSYKKYQ